MSFSLILLFAAMGLPLTSRSSFAQVPDPSQDPGAATLPAADAPAQPAASGAPAGKHKKPAPQPTTSSDSESDGPADRNSIIDEDDFASTPYTEYGEFNEDADEADDTKFFQYGRFYGISVGTGFQGVTGNRGALYQGGFPLVDIRVHYWFDFNLAIDLGLYTVQHTYENSGTHQVSMFNAGVDVKYYFKTQNLTAAVSFANPYVIAGFGSYSIQDANILDQTTEAKDTRVAPCAGAGLEFALRPKKVFISVETKAHFPVFRDTYTQIGNLKDLSGFFYTLTTNLLFTW